MCSLDGSPHLLAEARQPAVLSGCDLYRQQQSGDGVAGQAWYSILHAADGPRGAVEM